MLPLLAVSSSGLEQCLTHSRCTVNILGSITESPSCSLCLYLLLLVWFEFLTLYLNTPPCLHGVCLSPWFLSSHFIPWIAMCCLLHLSVGSWHLPSSWLRISYLSSWISWNWYPLLIYLLVTFLFLEVRELGNIQVDGAEQYTQVILLQRV